MASTGEFQHLPEEHSSIRQELKEKIESFRKDGADLPEHAEQELIALCELMREAPAEEDSTRALRADFSVFFTDQDGSETSEIIRIVRAQLEYAPESQRPELIRNCEAEIAKQIKPDTKLSLSLLALLGVISQYRTDNRVAAELLEVFDPGEEEPSTFFPFDSLSYSTEQSIRILRSVNRSYANALFHKILDFLEQYSVAFHASGRCSEESWRNYTSHFRKFGSLLTQNTNFLIFARYVQLVRLFEKANYGEDVFRPSVSLRNSVTEIMDDFRSSLLIGSRAGNNDYPGAIHFQLAPQYIARYRGGNMLDIFYIAEQEYGMLDNAISDAMRANKQEDKQIFKKIVQNSRRSILKNPPGMEPAISEMFELEDYFFTPNDFQKVAYLISQGNFEKIKNHNTTILLRNGFYSPPHQPLAKEDFFKILFPDARSFDLALYDEYAHLMRPQMHEVIEYSFGISLADKPLWVQRNFLRFLFSQGTYNFPSFARHLLRSGDDALISFLAIEGDPQFGKSLIEIGNRFGKAANPLFEKYAEIAKTAYRAADYLRNNFGGGADAESAVRQFTLNLLIRGKDLLRSCADEKSKKKFLRDIAAIDEQTSMVCAGVAALKGQHIDLKDVKPFRLQELSSEEMRENRGITRLVRAGYEKTLRKEWGDNQKVDRLLGEFDARVNDPENKSRFYVILRTDKTPNPLIGSTVFTDTGRGEKFWSALFFETAYRGSGFYPSIIMQALEKESKDALIRGKTSAVKDVAASYIEQAQFEGVRFHYDEEEKDGALIIERPINGKAKPEFPSPLVPFLTAGVSDQIAEKKPLIAFEADARDLFDPDMMEKIFAPLSAGYVLSRYTKDAKAAQLVFEYRG